MYPVKMTFYIFAVFICYISTVESRTSSISDGMRTSSGGLSYMGMMHEFKKEENQTIQMSKRSKMYLDQCRQLLIAGKRREYQQMEMPCPKPKFNCDPYSPYRTMDGTCNNLANPELGKSFKPQNRFLPAAYDDGIDSPRTLSISGGKLPSARVISENIFRQKGHNLDSRLSLLVMTYGQFAEHDVILTPSSTTDEQGHLIQCCTASGKVREECFPIRIAANDSHFKKRCMEFIRSTPVLKDPCKPCKPREQINELTSYVDASNIYGSTVEESDKLRLFKDGLLLTSPGRLLPRRADQTSCTLTHEHDFCLLAGDRRVQEVPTLASVHITFVRYHNHIARRLKGINPHWTDEYLFQETRKIIGAVTQKITYEEYLPAILNNDILRRFCLRPDCQYYDDRVDPSTVNSFGVTAFRFGHSQIPEFTALFKESYKRKKSCPYAAKRCPFKPVLTVKETERVPIENTFKNPSLVFKDVDGIQLFQVTNASTKSDRQFSDSIRNKLFLDSNLDSLDLAALDIQRGRDHGMPSYTKFREFCGLSKASYFHAGYNGLEDHDHHTIELLRKTYKHVEDIDLFVGGMTERPLPGSELGPTFSCIMAKQFERYKIGDRFWWRRRDPVVGFSSAQIKSLKRIRISKILCTMHNFKKIQPHAMIIPTYRWNRRVKCRSLPDLDLRPWKDEWRQQTSHRNDVHNYRPIDRYFQY